MSDLRGLIREVLAEELARLRSGEGDTRVREEVVTLRSNADLQAFVQRIVALAQDGRSRAEIEAGRHVFRLAPGGATAGAAPPMVAHQPAAPAPTAPPATVRFERGLVSERDIAALPEEQRSIRVGPSVRFTPLARDELRRRNIRIERAKS